MLYGTCMMKQRLEWRQPNPLAQLKAFVMRLEGVAVMPSLSPEDVLKRVEERAEELRQLIPFIEGKKEWVDINGLQEYDECPNCKFGTLGRENGRLVCRGECGTDFSP